MVQVNLISAIESAIEVNGLESVIQILADTVAAQDNMTGDMGFGFVWYGDDWKTAADMIRAVVDKIPDSIR